MLLPYLQRYNIEFSKQLKEEKNCIVTFRDLNHDGISEKLIFINDTLGFSSLLIYEGDVVHGQWSLKGKFTRGVFYTCGDYDKNGIDEIYVFTTERDSLYLNIIESYTSKVIRSDKPIRKLHVINGIVAILLHSAALVDLNSDNTDELLIVISTGYNYWDRSMYSYYIDKDSLVESPTSASSLGYPYTILKNDSSIVISGMIHESGNTDYFYPYTDKYAWFMAWDNNLDFMFDPVVIGKYHSNVFTKPFIQDDKLFFAGFYDYYGMSDTSEIFIANSRGEIIKQKKLIYLKGRTAFLPNDTRDELTIIDSHGEITVFDNSLNLKSRSQCKKVYYYDYFRRDITGDGVPDKIYNSNDFSSCVFFDPVSLTMIPIDIPLNNMPANISKYTKGGKSYISFSFPGKIILYSFEKSLFYSIRYITPLLLFVVSLLLLLGARKIFNFYLNKRIARHNQIAKLQLLNVKGRLDSHFTFNMIDCIGNTFRKNDFETADKLFVRYARLLQQSIQFSGEIAIPLEEELAYIENYLILEKTRSNNSFDFRILNNVSSGIEVPKFMLFTFVENAVKHGVMPLTDRRGQISVETHQVDNSIEVAITDNGIGIGDKHRKTTGTGNGLKIVDQLIKLFKSEYNLIINYLIGDAKPGTSIHITLEHGK